MEPPCHHMSIREAVQCGCARAEHKEAWDVDIIKHSQMFPAGSPAIAAFMATRVTNCIPHPVSCGELQTNRINTPFGSVRCMPHMDMAMGHSSITGLCAAVGICREIAELGRHLRDYAGCITMFSRFTSENEVCMVEVARCLSSNRDADVPHTRFPGARKGRKVKFRNNRAIHPKCGSIEEAIQQTDQSDESDLVALGYNPKRWQVFHFRVLIHNA